MGQEDAIAELQTIGQRQDDEGCSDNQPAVKKTCRAFFAFSLIHALCL
jgi:hypothetical protein